MKKSHELPFFGRVFRNICVFSTILFFSTQSIAQNVTVNPNINVSPNIFINVLPTGEIVIKNDFPDLYVPFQTNWLSVTCHGSDSGSQAAHTCPSQVGEDTYTPDWNKFAIYGTVAPSIQRLTPQGETKTKVKTWISPQGLVLTPNEVARLTPTARSLYQSGNLWRTLKFHLQTDVNGSNHDATAQVRYSGFLVRLYE